MTAAAELRQRFATARGFPLDPFQEQALDAVDARQSVLVAAPTGSGKTLVAEYAIEHARASGGKAFYTTPLKALSNQKYGDLVRAYGADHVGLLTGDNSINGDAPVVVMTTEVLRNMIYAASPALDGLSVVVLDEVHYLQDRYRGPVWEEVIVHLDTSVRLVCLSATVSRRGRGRGVDRDRTGPHHRGHRGAATGDPRASLPGGGARRGHAAPAPDLHRGPRTQRAQPRGGAPRPAGRPWRRRAREPSRFRSERRWTERRRAKRGPEPWGRVGRAPFAPAHTDARRDRRAPRPGRDAPRDRVRVQSRRMRSSSATVRGRRTAPHRHQRARRLRQIAEAHTSTLADEDLEVLGYRDWLAGLEAGFAAHHAGMVPPMKEAIEEAFAAGLAKVVFATETLALGINMPRARW